MRTPLRSIAGLLALVAAVSFGQQWWQGRNDADVGTQVRQMARTGDIRMLSSETCIYCKQARIWFDAHQVPYQECLIERDAACRAEFQALRAPGTPMLVVRGQAQVGFSPARIQEALRPRV